MILCKQKVILPLFVLVFLILSVQCSNDSVSGGTGTGNPPVVACSIVMMADTSEGAAKRRSDQVAVPGINDDITPPRGAFRISDPHGMELTVDSVFIRVTRLYLLCEDTPDTSALDEISTELGYDSKGLYIQGPFVFNAVDGTCSPSLDSLSLPEGEYTGIEMVPSEGESEQDYLGAPVEISGNFMDEDTLKGFIIRLSESELMNYRLDTGTTGLWEDDESLFLIHFYADMWLDSVNFQGYLSSSDPVYDQQGNLIMDINDQGGALNSVVSQIGRNILRSGEIEILY